MTTGERPAFSHQALFYDGGEEFLGATIPFVRAAVEREEPILVAVTRPRARALAQELGDAAALVRFADMERLGRNPARIIPAWQRFVDAHGGPGSPVRGIGEPIWPGRTPAELAECRRHEALLNLAFADAPAWDLLCPYDTSSLDDDILDGACHTHPYLCDGTDPLRDSHAYLAPEDAPLPFHGQLPEPDNATFQMRFGLQRLPVVRQVVAGQAVMAGVPAARISDLVLSVNELASNSISHGGGSGLLRIWRSDDALVCEVRDSGRIGDPLVGRREPSAMQARGRGVWLANQLCDLLQIRWVSTGTVVRVHVHAA